MANPSSIKVQNLNVYIGDNHILKNINVEIPEKKITCIIGPSGCGKTTLFKSFNRLLENNVNTRIEGKVLVDGQDIYDKNANVTSIRKKMGLLNQRPTPLPMSIHANVVYGLKIHGIRDKKVHAQKVTHYLKIASLWDEVKNRLADPASGLSIGQQQRLCLARGLAVEPSIILGDEPTSALDVSVQSRFLDLLTELQEKLKFACLFISHDLAVVDILAHRIAVMQNGLLVEEGDRDDILLRPQNDYTRRLISAVPVPDPAEQRIRREARLAAKN